MKIFILKYSLYALVAVVVGCSSVHKLTKLQPVANVEYTDEEQIARRNIGKEDTTKPDTTNRVISYVRGDGQTQILNEVVYDSLSNTNMSQLHISEVKVSARSLQHTVERNGKIHINFQMVVPSELQHSSWQVNLQPILSYDKVLTDSLEPVLLTGSRFRASQYKDYALYDKYLQKIIPDSADFFNSYVKRRSYYNYTRGLIRRREYLEDKMYRPVKMRLNILPERFELFNRMSLRKDSVYERNIIEKQQLIYARKTMAYSDAAVNLADKSSMYTRNQERISRMDFDDLKVRSLYGLGGWFPLHHYSYMRHGEQAVQRDSSKSVHRAKTIKSMYERLDKIDSSEIVQRFIDTKKVESNKQRIFDKGRMFNKIVPHPFQTAMRLDSVINLRDTLRYFYSQEVEANENTTKLHVYLDGSLIKHSGEFYEFASPDTLHFNVSSMTTFIDEQPRYVQRIITRDAEANARFSIEFPKNKSALIAQYGDNIKELKKVKDVISKLMNDPIYIIDSIKVTAASSPEGGLSVNTRLAKERSVAFSEFMKEELKYWRDSLDVQSMVVLNEDGTSTIQKAKEHLPNLDSKIRVESIPEDWEKLSQMIVANDSLIKHGDAILAIIADIASPDRREVAIRRAYPTDYEVMRNKLYPKLRAVDVKFNLLRRGMMQDTVYTTELDSVYAEGVKLLKHRKYEAAIELLRPYEDVNTALAYMSLGLDDAALRIFLKQKQTDNILYVTAILYARKGDAANAVQQLMRAVEINPRLRFRAGLDPELALLMKRYNLFAD